MQNRGCLRAQGRSPINFLAAVVLLHCASGTVNGAATGTFKKLLVFGDSYVDTGNRDPNNATSTPIGPVNQAWLPPYGRTRPGGPAGHFSDGDLLSEFLGKYMGLNPKTYRKYKLDSSTSTADGMNFAVGGAGVFNNLGFTKTRDQIAQFEALLDANVFDRSSVFSESVILFAISGNDYAAFSRNLPGANLTIVVTAIVDQMVQDLKSLYALGFRNFVISELQPLDCLPSATATTNYTACVAPLAAIPLAHNLYLNTEIALNFPSSSHANIILLDNQAAFYNIISNPLPNGFKFPLKPCCVAPTGTLCGDLDSNDKPLYTLCSSSSPSPFFWDENHPTEAGWRKVFRLYVNSVRYTHEKSLPAFLGVQKSQELVSG